ALKPGELLHADQRRRLLRPGVPETCPPAGPEVVLLRPAAHAALARGRPAPAYLVHVRHDVDPDPSPPRRTGRRAGWARGAARGACRCRGGDGVRREVLELAVHGARDGRPGHGPGTMLWCLCCSGEGSPWGVPL